MKDIANQRCFNHAVREAAALCPECSRSFCRECITEHNDRVLCASCLKKGLTPAPARTLRFTGIIRLGQSIFGFLIIWLFFYYLAQLLLSIPSNFHDGTVWQTLWWAE